MAKTSAAQDRCSRCSAGLRPGAPWCTQCYAPTAGPATAVPAPSSEDRTAAAPSAVTVAERPAPAGGTWPCSACGTANDLARADCQDCGTPFLADERGAVPTVVLPVVGDLLGLSPARRVAVAVGLVLAFLLVTAGLALLLS